MYQHTRLSNNSFGFFQKFRNFDYILLACILLLGFISLATMYSTDGGNILFHTKSHFVKLVVFTTMMLIFSFINAPPPKEITVPVLLRNLRVIFFSKFLKKASPFVWKIFSILIFSFFSITLSISKKSIFSSLDKILPIEDFPDPIIPVKTRLFFN